MKKLFILLIYIATVCNALAQYTLSGKVYLKDNKADVFFAEGYIIDLKTDISIDPFGNFSLLLPKGKHSIRFSANKYKPITIEVHESLEGDVKGNVFLVKTKKKENSWWAPFATERSKLNIRLGIGGNFFIKDYSKLSAQELYDYAYMSHYNHEYNEAKKCFKLAADRGHVKSQYQLGKMYAEGIGVVKDSLQADAWFKKAKENGYKTDYVVHKDNTSKTIYA